MWERPLCRDSRDTKVPPTSRNHQSFPDLDWLRIATRKSLQPIARQGLDSAAKFLEQRRRIAPRAAYNFQFQTLTPGSAYNHKLAGSVRLKEVFVRFNPTISAVLRHRYTGKGSSLEVLGGSAFAKATAHSLQPSKCARSGAGAGDEARTRDVHLGKVVLYQLSYTRSFERDNNVQPTAPRNLLIAPGRRKIVESKSDVYCIL